jgi:hypothetical protein
LCRRKYVHAFVIGELRKPACVERTRAIIDGIDRLARAARIDYQDDSASVYVFQSLLKYTIGDSVLRNERYRSANGAPRSQIPQIVGHQIERVANRYPVARKVDE